MHTYHGTNGSGLIIVNVAGKGVWAYPQVPDDGDPRAAFTVGTGLEAAQDCIVWLFHHMIDGLVGGTYDADFEWTGEHSFAGPVIFTDDVAFQDDVIFNDPVTFNDDVVFNDPVMLVDTTTRSGALAYVALRKGNGPDATVTTTIHDKDVTIVPDLAVSRVWTLAAPPNHEIVEATIHWPEQTGIKSLELKDGSRTLVLLDSSSRCHDGSVATVVLVYRGNGIGWTVKSVLRGPRIFIAPDLDQTIDAYKYDVIEVPSLADDRAWILSAPPTDEWHEVLIRWKTQAGMTPRTLSLVGPGPVGLVDIESTVLPAPNAGVFNGVMQYDATANQWFLKSAAGGHTLTLP